MPEVTPIRPTCPFCGEEYDEYFLRGRAAVRAVGSDVWHCTKELSKIYAEIADEAESK